MREEVLAHDRQVGYAGLFEALTAGLRKAGIGAARVVIAGTALEQPLALQAVDETGQAAAR